jgi:glycerophosphoryl diester phosphodiesterase
MDRPLVLAHRGARRAAPENTLVAFAAARAQGADGVELDARRTRDDALVVHHDPGPPGEATLATLELGDVRRAWPSIPTLDEALDECRGLLVNIEIKNLPWDPDFDPDERVTDLVVARLTARGGADRVLISSFNLPTIDRVHAHDAALSTALLFVAGADPRQMVDLVIEHGHRAIHPDLRTLEGPNAAELVDVAHRRGLAVNVWTVNDPADVVRVAALGVDGLVSDVPDVALAALARRGQAREGRPTARRARNGR